MAGFCLLNAVAWMQAHAMTHYVPEGVATQKPEALTLPEKAWTILSGVTVPRPKNAFSPADKGLAYTELTIDAGQGEALDTWLVPATSPAPRLVIMFPGYAASKDSLLSAARALHGMECDLLMVDFRGAGGSSGQDTTLGFREAKDVALATGYASQEWPGRYRSIVLYGTSMGAAAVMRAVAVEKVQADALVLESPFNSLLDTASNRFHAMGLPAFPSAQLIMLWGSLESGYDGFTNNPEE
jgi:pimeloyl-ACP methyl ester carboxylesterase